MNTMSDTRNLLVIGGFTESKRILEPLADEAVKHGFGHDAGVLTLHEARRMSDKRLRMMVAGASIVTHSAGILTVPDASKRTSDRELPEDLIVIAGPEPRPFRALAGAAIKKTGAHLSGNTARPHSAHLRIVAGNVAEAIAHPVSTPALVPQIGRFSTMNRLGADQVAASNRQGNFMMMHDEYYANPLWRQYSILRHLQQEGWVVGELPGSHDEALLDPAGVMAGISQTFEVAEPVPR